MKIDKMVMDFRGEIKFSPRSLSTPSLQKKKQVTFKKELVWNTVKIKKIEVFFLQDK